MKKILSIIIIGILIGCSFGVQGLFLKKPSEETTNTDLGDFFFDKKIELFMTLAKFPSLSACVIEGDQVTWSNSYGFYNLKNRKEASEDTIYNIGSITKTITGTALMQLWEQGFFDLDEDITNYLPFPFRNPHFPDNPITFRMLLSHSSSLNSESMSQNGYYWFNFSDDAPFSFYPFPWLEEHLIPGGIWYYPERWSTTYRPGEYNMYANINFDIIAYLVELISGESFVDYCKNHIFTPLEMYDTSFNLSELDIDNVAIPYHYHNGEYLQINDLSYLFGSKTPPNKYWRILNIPVGGLYSTISDLSHFFIAHMNDGVWNDVRILKEKTVEEMHTVQPPGNKGSSGDYLGLEWEILENPGIFNVTLMEHSGGNIGVLTRMNYISYGKIGFIIFANGDEYYEQESPLTSIVNGVLIPNSLLKKAGYNLFSHIDFGNIGGE